MCVYDREKEERGVVSEGRYVFGIREKESKRGNRDDGENLFSTAKHISRGRALSQGPR